MALSRKLLSTMGIEDDKIDQIIEAHTETVNALKDERDEAQKTADKYKFDAERLPGILKELDELKAADGKEDAWKVKYDAKTEELEALQKEYDEYKTGITAKETKEKKQEAYRALLKEIGISEKRLDAVLKVSDVEKVELTEDGKIKDSDKLTEEIKGEWSDFIVKESTKGADTAKPPESNGNGQPSLAAKIAQQYHENLYGKTKED